MTDEYIKRTDALSLKKPFPNQKDMVTLYRQYFIDPKAVEQLPAADVVPVVRCKYCVYCAENAFAESDEAYCSEHDCCVSETYFCADGKRKEWSKND